MGGSPQRAHRRLRVIAHTAATHKPIKSGFAWRGNRYQVAQARAAIKRDQHAAGVVYLGPPAQTPVLIGYVQGDKELRAIHPKSYRAATPLRW